MASARLRTSFHPSRGSFTIKLDCSRARRPFDSVRRGRLIEDPGHAPDALPGSGTPRPHPPRHRRAERLPVRAHPFLRQPHAGSCRTRRPGCVPRRQCRAGQTARRNGGHWREQVPAPSLRTGMRDNPPVIVEVIAAYPGASAEEVERQVTVPLEATFAGMPRLKSLRSKSSTGLSLAARRVQARHRLRRLQARSHQPPLDQHPTATTRGFASDLSQGGRADFALPPG